MNAENKTRKLNELQIGDVVKLANFLDGRANCEMTVVNVTKEKVDFFRPYVSLGNFTHVGGVTPYIGIENVSVSFVCPCEFHWIENIYRGEK